MSSEKLNYQVGDFVQPRDGGPPMRIVQVTTGFNPSVLVEWMVDGVAEIATLLVDDVVECEN